MLRMVGYFSLVGLLRVHTLVGDYYGALKALGAIHPFQRSNLFTPKIASKHTSTPSSAAACSPLRSPSPLQLPSSITLTPQEAPPARLL